MKTMKTVEQDGVYVEWNIDDQGRIVGDVQVGSDGHMISVPPKVMYDFVLKVFFETKHAEVK